MNSEQRLLYLKIGAAGVIALWLLNMVVIEPIFTGWGERTDRITELRKNVDNGQKLLDREQVLRGEWSDMMKANLPAEVSAAEEQAFKAVVRWTGASRITFTNLSKDWKDGDEGPKGYKTLVFRISANGDQASIGRFLYELETDPIPVNLEKCELATRDARGSQLTLTATFSFMRLPEPEKKQ